MNSKQKKLLLVSLVMFWLTIIYQPQCDNIRGFTCNVLYEYDFFWVRNFGVYVPSLIIEWVAIAVNFVALFFYFDDKNP